jgi:hypothetical protein
MTLDWQRISWNIKGEIVYMKNLVLKDLLSFLHDKLQNNRSKFTICELVYTEHTSPNLYEEIQRLRAPQNKLACHTFTRTNQVPHTLQAAESCVQSLFYIHAELQMSKFSLLS